MKRIDLLITESRRTTGNQNYTSETGVQDAEFIRALNDAQERIQSLILNTYPRLFQKRKEIDAVTNQEAYDNPVDLFMDTRIEKIEYSNNGDSKNYYKLDAGETDEQLNTTSGAPSFYIRESKQFLSQPAPQGGGKFRMTYQRSFPKLDKRRGKVLTVALDGTTKTINSLVLDPTLITNDDAQEINDTEYICVVSKDGTVKMTKIPCSVDTNTGIVTVDADFVYETGETIDVGDWVVTGKYATTHSQLSDICERYLLQFCNWRILKRDSSNDSAESNQELKEMENEIIDSYRKADNDVKGIPILDYDYLSF